jgi:hypothetical protein
VGDVPPALRDDLLAYLLCDSSDRAWIIARVDGTEPRHRRVADDLEADDDLRAKVEIELLRGQASSGA